LSYNFLYRTSRNTSLSTPTRRWGWRCGRGCPPGWQKDVARPRASIVSTRGRVYCHSKIERVNLFSLFHLVFVVVVVVVVVEVVVGPTQPLIKLTSILNDRNGVLSDRHASSFSSLSSLYYSIEQWFPTFFCSRTPKQNEDNSHTP